MDCACADKLLKLNFSFQLGATWQLRISHGKSHPPPPPPKASYSLAMLLIHPLKRERKRKRKIILVIKEHT